MSEIKIGDKVRLSSNPQYPCPGYVLGDAEGTIINWLEWEELMEGFEDYVYVKIDKTGKEGKEFIGKCEFFLKSDIQKM